jgi:hypothetical protein
MGFIRGPSVADQGLKTVINTGTDTSLTLTELHSGVIFLCGGATLAVTLPAAAELTNGWNVMFIGEDASSGTLTATTTITGAGTNELIGHTVTGGDNGNRQLQPPSAGAKDNVKLHTIAARGDWVEITKIGSNFLVFGSSRINNGLPMA